MRRTRGRRPNNRTDAIEDPSDIPAILTAGDPNDFANESRDELQAALEEAGVTYETNVYPDTQHASHNDTGQRYNTEQAIAAWEDILAWFARYLGGNGEATPVATPVS